MGSILGASTKRRQQLLLLSALVLALFITIFFGMRAFRRFDRPPTDEPIRGWMNIPYIAHSYQVPPPVLWEALDPPPDLPRSRRPINRLAEELNLTTTEVISRLETAIADERAKHPPPAAPPEKPPHPVAPELSSTGLPTVSPTVSPTVLSTP
ncbi:MAG: hypothetical protein DYG89_33595 [Caldilinea sp. CFX5]|nr:hypothetical protein [Caldilinea sp. CFX5]